MAKKKSQIWLWLVSGATFSSFFNQKHAVWQPNKRDLEALGLVCRQQCVSVHVPEKILGIFKEAFTSLAFLKAWLDQANLDLSAETQNPIRTTAPNHLADSTLRGMQQS